jgi:hypothetical protein
MYHMPNTWTRQRLSGMSASQSVMQDPASNSGAGRAVAATRQVGVSP